MGDRTATSRRGAASSWEVTMALSLWLLGHSEPAAAKKIARFEAQVSATLIAVDAAGRFTAVPDVTAQLACIGPEALGRHQNLSCQSSIVVKRGDAVIAKADRGLLGVDIDMVAGNDSSVKLQLLSADDGLSFLVLEQWEQTGDEELHQTTSRQLLVLDGATLRPVYSYRALTSWSPGPGVDRDRVPPSALRSAIKVKRDGGRTREVTNLLEIRSSGPDDSFDSEAVLIWNGKAYAPCESCKSTPLPPSARKPPEPKPPAAPPPSVAVPAAQSAADPMSLIDANTKVSIEPLLGKVLRGERLTAEALKPLAATSLTRLRNAAYARHGRPFKSAELRAFFYGARANKSATSLLPLTESAAFTDSMLDEADRANIKLVLAESRDRPAP